jgi:pantoate--beta-alanine ligase
MQIIHSPEEFRTACNELRLRQQQVGLVPTMGALHAGHASLMAMAQKSGAVPCVSIFVNPTQFGPNEDFSKYPRTLEADAEICRAEGVALVFAPAAADMYAPADSTRVRVSGLTEGLCGRSRPGHFDGVTTIVAKLLALAGPCKAFFGRKDYQQLQVVSRMVADLMLPASIIGCPIVREADGLALSSRNRYLSPEDRVRALGLIRGLLAANGAYRRGERQARALCDAVERELLRCGLRTDYVELRQAETLSPVEVIDVASGPCVLAVAAVCGNTRLIDNVVLGVDDLTALGQIVDGTDV